ncbi:MAG: hypothetical protein AABZ77_01890, partial [Chloroflexota bacterium]
NKKTGLVIGISIFVIALGILGMASFQKADEKSRLEKQFTSSQARLQGIKLESLSSQPAELEKQLSDIIPELERVKAELSQPISSANATAAVFDVAKTHGLAVTEMTSSSSTNETVAGVTLSAISMTAKVEGKASEMVAFITALNSRLKTSVIKSVEITVPEISSTDNSSARVGDNRTASIELVVYTYRGE